MQGQSKDEWVQHPYTVHLRKETERRRDAERDKLILLCRSASDTAIAVTFQRYSALEEQAKLLKGDER
jgi:hypothetical protein